MPHQPAVYTRRRLIAATAAVLVPAASYSLFGRGSAQSDAAAPEPTPDLPDARTSSTDQAPIAGPTIVEQVPPIEFGHAFGDGMNGPEVVALQNRLKEVGFDPGDSDGQYGPATKRAVWAFEKFLLDVNPAEVTGVVTPSMWARMNQPIAIRPRRASPGTHLEILLPLQVAVLYIDNEARLITHVSSGTGEQWCDVVLVDNDDGTQTEQGICGVAVTPGGVFHFERRVDGWRNSKLGRLWNPVYFNYGIAVHGASNVPSYPASHGCVRIPMHIADYFPSLVRDGDLVYVFDGVEEPEKYGAQVPIFDFPDPSYTTTTTSSSTSTTGPTTTVPPAPTTTHSPHPTTTAAPSTSTTASPTTTVGE